MHRSIVGSGKENQRAPILRCQLGRKIVEEYSKACDVEIMGLSYDRGEFQNVPRYYEKWSVLASGSMAKNVAMLREGLLIA